MGHDGDEACIGSIRCWECTAAVMHSVLIKKHTLAGDSVTRHTAWTAHGPAHLPCRLLQQRGRAPAGVRKHAACPPLFAQHAARVRHYAEGSGHALRLQQPQRLLLGVEDHAAEQLEHKAGRLLVQHRLQLRQQLGRVRVRLQLADDEVHLRGDACASAGAAQLLSRRPARAQRAGAALAAAGLQDQAARTRP